MADCPICAKRPPSLEKNIAPFCSARCKQIDLGHWLSENYRVAGPAVSESVEDVPTHDQGEEKRH